MARRRGRPSWRLPLPALCLALSIGWIGWAAAPVTLERLRADKHLTPRKFASHFSDFRYVLHDEVQSPEVFLATRAGDCDDYAVLADMVLRERRYQTRLVSVRMSGLLTHAVCYVNEAGLYLDFNNRGYLIRTQRCGPDLREIAAKVAQSLDAHWTSASEFTYTDGVKHLVATVVKTDARGVSTVHGKTNVTVSF